MKYLDWFVIWLFYTVLFIFLFWGGKGVPSLSVLVYSGIGSFLLTTGFFIHYSLIRPKRK